MKKRGFTLIELLAVIVILAIIALIATPIILGVIDDAKKGAAKSSALGYIDAVEKKIALDLVDNPSSVIPTTFSATNVEVKGDKPTAVSMTLSNGVVTAASIKIGGYTVSIVGASITVTK